MISAMYTTTDKVSKFKGEVAKYWILLETNLTFSGRH